MGITAKTAKELALEVILFCSGITIMSLAYTNNVLTTSLLIIALIIGIKFWHKKHDICFLVVGAIVGPVAEIICTRFGVWQYTNPTILGIPIWLPLAWGLVTVLVKRIVETLMEI